MNIPAIMLTDFYKTDHHRQYPPNTTKVYSNFTPRISRLAGVNHVVVFGIQYFIEKYLVEEFNTTFFQVEKAKVIGRYANRIALLLEKRK